MMVKIGRPNIADAPGWYPYFFKLAQGDELLEAMEVNKQQTLELMASIPASAENFRYAAGKWTTKQVFIHLVQDERYYAYKSFCFSQQIDVFLEVPPPFDHFGDNANAAHRTLKDIAEEFITVRDATISLFKHVKEAMLDFKAIPGNTHNYTIRSLGWMVVGHNVHHCNMVREKYL